MVRMIIALLVLASLAAADPKIELSKEPEEPKAPSSALCSPCVQLDGQALNILLNELLNVGVVGSCGKLCSHLKTKGAQTACSLVCDVVGLKAFVKALNNTDLDPIYFCELIHACKAGPDDAHVDLLSVQLNPESFAKKDTLPGSGGITVEGVLAVNVTKATGVGEWGVSLHGPVVGAQGPIGGSFALPDGLKEGVQQLGVKLNVQDTEPDPSKQPPQFPVTFEPGSYEFRFHVCQGECGSKHPHSIDFGRKSANFTISDSRGSFVV